MRFNNLIHTKFRGCQQIGFLDDPHVGRHLRIYKLPESVLNNGEDLVGIHDGSSSWVASPKHCLFHMKQGVSPSFPAEVRGRATLKRDTVSSPRKSLSPERKKLYVN